MEAKSGFNKYRNLSFSFTNKERWKSVRKLIIPEVEAGDLFTVAGKQVAIDKGGSVPATSITRSCREEISRNSSGVASMTESTPEWPSMSFYQQ